MNKSNHTVRQIHQGLGLALLLALTGCVGYVGGGYGGRATVFVPGPEVTVFGGGFERGHDEHEYSRRGYESRGGDRR
jgi:hypothetical protein